ncbi:hypothetical protein M408DRAFT_158168 [Serendipita vermifera MAFF 305830]|uniref:Uncharacterized protein n=1 Tax=Serendipita vermifera MAFF 305830 TaxID=933852 RepID=A0A0C2XXR5_SERVB|nr:hypothetical protein M408DRAFT_158168 [Serendipita vermifera MAFF 305830]
MRGIFFLNERVSYSGDDRFLHEDTGPAKENRNGTCFIQFGGSKENGRRTPRPRARFEVRLRQYSYSSIKINGLEFYNKHSDQNSLRAELGLGKWISNFLSHHYPYCRI